MGRVWMRIRDWFDWRFYWPGRYRDVFRQPKTVFIGEPLSIAEPGLQGVWLEPPADMGKPVWRDVLDWVQMSPPESDALHAEGETEPALSLRIWGRIAVKEVARRLWLEQGQPPIHAADLIVDDLGSGRFQVRPMSATLEGVTVKLAGTEGAVIAIGSCDPSEKIGLAIERIEGLASAEEWRARTRVAIEAIVQVIGREGRATAIDRDLETGRIHRQTCADRDEPEGCGIRNSHGPPRR